jgi:hypothetical protein
MIFASCYAGLISCLKKYTFCSVSLPFLQKKKSNPTIEDILIAESGFVNKICDIPFHMHEAGIASIV